MEELNSEDLEVSLENYVEDFTVYEFTEELDVTVGDRHFEAEEAPENNVEELIMTFKENLTSFLNHMGKTRRLKFLQATQKKDSMRGRI